jgi:hypothetical protein
LVETAPRPSSLTRSALGAISLLIVVSFAWQADRASAFARMDAREASLQYRLPPAQTQVSFRLKAAKKDRHAGIELRTRESRREALRPMAASASCALARPEVPGELWIDLPPPTA